ncbi:MAG: flavodoxin family protein [Armatimonadota bacterium]
MPKVAVIYYSKTGNTRRMAELVAEGCGQVAGVEVAMVELPGMDLGEAAQVDGFAIGSPEYFSYAAGHVKTFFDEALAYKANISGKPYVAFGTHGGGARVLESLERLSQALGLKQVRPGMMCLGAPGPSEEDDVRSLGRALAEALCS